MAFIIFYVPTGHLSTFLFEVFDQDILAGVFLDIYPERERRLEIGKL